MTGQEDENLFYYLRIPAGESGVFTIVPAVYKMTPYYLELWDPVYGDTCSDPGSKTLYAQRNIRLTFHSCQKTIPRQNAGEPTQLKYMANWRYIY